MEIEKCAAAVSWPGAVVEIIGILAICVVICVFLWLAMKD